jgi:hypothetical protein
MLVRQAIDKDGIRGELSIFKAHDAEVNITLAREAVAVCKHADDSGLPVVGVLDIPDLEVNEDWTRARPHARARELIAEVTEQLYLALARTAESASGDLRAVIRDHALAFLVWRGMASAAAIERMTGAAQALTRAPVFRTSGGEWVTLSALADHVMRGDKVGILEKRFLTPDVGDGLVLEAADPRAPWVHKLKDVLGPASLERIEDLPDWKRERAEADPASGTPTLKGLVKLRRQLKLLRAGALGRLTPEEIKDVRLSTAKQKRRVEYDAQRKMLLLDANDPQVVRALDEMPLRPERLYVLLAACYGEINRALLHITDEHEADLLASMAIHLASNPEHLSPAPAEADKEPA